MSSSPQNAAVSFKFTKSENRKRSAKKALGDDVSRKRRRKSNDTPHRIVLTDNHSMRDVLNTSHHQDLIIPLAPSRWIETEEYKQLQDQYSKEDEEKKKIPELESDEKEDASTVPQLMQLDGVDQEDKEAIQSLLAQAKNLNSESTEPSTDDLIIIPSQAGTQTRPVDRISAYEILRQRVVPHTEGIDDYKRKMRLDMAQRPPVEEDESFYDGVSFDRFGEGMLRGMGWSKGRSLGNAYGEYTMEEVSLNDSDVKPRARGLGVGAKLTEEQLAALEARAKRGRRNQGLKPGEQMQEYVTGHEKPKKRDKSKKKPQKLNFDMTQYGLQHIGSHPDKEQRRKKKRRSRSREKIKRVSIDRDDSPDTDNIPMEVKKTKREHEHEWIANGLRVRIVTRKFGERYYEKKGRVVDVISPLRFLLRMESSGAMLECNEVNVESVVPKVGGHVMVVRGELVGMRGRVLEKKKKKLVAVVQFDDDLAIKNCLFDDICEF